MMLKKIVIFSFAYLVALFCSTTNALLARPTSDAIGQSYIVGGHDVDIDKFPYQVAIETSDNKLRCGGSIIGLKYVLTSCYCVEISNIAHVRAGSSIWGSGGSLHKISKIFRHEKCTTSSDGFTNDIAILKVEPKFVLDATRKCITLSNREQDFSAGELSTVTGYWMNDSSTELLKHLKAVQVPMVTRTFCNQVYNVDLGALPILKDRVCAGKKEGGLGPCVGDAGGPLVIGNQQVGIFSYSHGCVRPNIPAVYTKVAHFSEWIQKIFNHENS